VSGPVPNSGVCASGHVGPTSSNKRFLLEPAARSRPFGTAALRSRRLLPQASRPPAAVRNLERYLICNYPWQCDCGDRRLLARPRIPGKVDLSKGDFFIYAIGRSLRLPMYLAASMFVGCNKPQVSQATGDPELPTCLEITVASTSESEVPTDSVWIIPLQAFVVRLDTAKAGDGAEGAYRLGMLGRTGESPLTHPGIWSRPATEIVSLRWWDGTDGLGIEFKAVGELWEGAAYYFDDTGCPGSDYCWTGEFTARAMACPEGPWYEMERWRWVPWTDGVSTSTQRGEESPG